MFFPQGSRDNIIAKIGAPLAAYPAIQEAISYNEAYDLWISAPPGVMVGTTYGNYFGGVYLTKKGTLEKFVKVTDPENPNFDIEVVADAVTAYGQLIDKAYTPEVPDTPGPYVASTLVLTVDSTLVDRVGTTFDVALTISGTTTHYEVLANAGNLWIGGLTGTDVGSVAAGVYTLTHEDGVLPLDDVASATDIVVTFKVDIETDTVLTLFQNSPRSAETTFEITDFDIATTVGTPPVDNLDYNTMSFTVSELPYVGGALYTSPVYKVSTDPSKKDGFNKSLAFTDVFTGNPYASGIVYAQFTDVSPTLTFPVTTIVSGQRVLEDPAFDNTSDLAGTLQAGWDLVTGPAFAGVNVFFEPSGDPGISLAAKRTEYKFATGIQSLKPTTALDPNIPAQNSLLKIIQIDYPSLSRSTGLAAYCNEFKMKDLAGAFYWEVPLGSVAAMLTAIMEYKLGGVAPMFTNATYNTASLGGQLLGRSVYKQKYALDADALDELDQFGVNPIVLDATYGLMITSQKTLQSNLTLTDWSYLGH